jgi:hypothetical protein
MAKTPEIGPGERLQGSGFLTPTRDGTGATALIAWMQFAGGGGPVKSAWAALNCAPSAASKNRLLIARRWAQISGADPFADALKGAPVHS